MNQSTIGLGLVKKVERVELVLLLSVVCLAALQGRGVDGVGLRVEDPLVQVDLVLVGEEEVQVLERLPQQSS